MEIFVDSSKPEEIREAAKLVTLTGVTTNPSLISAGGSDMIKTLTAVLDASPGPVFAQSIGWHDPEPLVAQARWLHRFSDRIIVKLPMTPAGIQSLRQLKQTDPGMTIAITALASVSQAYLCAKHGADIVALFNGPLDVSTENPVELVAPVRAMIANYGFKTKILSCGRFPRHFAEFAVAGTDICTLKLEFLKLLFDHPYTDKRMHGFTDDWKKSFGESTWPTE